MNFGRKFYVLLSLSVLIAVGLSACSETEQINKLSDLSGGKEFAVPTGTVADKLVTSKIPDARFQYFNTVLDAALAVKAGKAAAVAYDEPILKNIAAKVPGLKVLPEPITVDEYGFAVRLGDTALKDAVDAVVSEAQASGEYQKMLDRWLPATGEPGPMPEIPMASSDDVIRFGTAAVTEPFSYVDGSKSVVGLDIEIARKAALKLNKKIEIVNLEFGALIPALISGKVDMIGACITITEERSQKVLFANSYYKGGISALVRQ